MTISSDSKILVVGCGGLGCELLRILVLQGFSNISVVDHDTVALSNLNRQFLFRRDDVGRYKAEVSFQLLNEVSKCFICKVEELSLEELREYHIILSAVDSIETRRWINAALFQLDKTERLLIDGGSQNLYGHVRVVRPGATSCIECSLSLFTTEETVACSLTGTPKTPEDCIQYAMQVDWETDHPNVYPDTRSKEVLEWLYKSSLERAKKHGIEGVTRNLVEVIATRTIPNLSTTNAIIASLMVNILSSSELYGKNYYFYSGDGETCLSAFNLEADPECTICKCTNFEVSFRKSQSLGELVAAIRKIIHATHISLMSEKGIIYTDSPESMRLLYSERLNESLETLDIDDAIFVTSHNTTFFIHLKLH